MKEKHEDNNEDDDDHKFQNTPPPPRQMNNEQMNKTMNIAGCISQIRWLWVTNGWVYYLLRLGNKLN